ncbi:hypothetical protein XENOCAPTIV_006448 [Xenoophorus captivus]|uniref:B30.2/SPRY domain-containing protein n=1 Tax=Xenoophorus captivus TaxID=1517983 RepID=A0ABV0QUW8_9TELE
MERDIEILEKDLEELRKRDEEISQLLQTEDNVRLSQVTRAAPLLCSPLTADPLSRAFSLPTEAFSDARKALSHLRSSIEDTCTEGVDKISRAGNENYVFGGELVNDSCRLSLDSNTAHPTLLLLEDPQGAHCGEETQPHPPHPHRFDSVAQVLCREGQFGAASYWEVEWRGGGWVDIAITMLSIGRKGGGKPCLLGRNENSWRLRCTHTGYSAWHDNRKTTVAAPPCPRIGVLLERQKGALSFYSVSDTVVLLHTFHSQFSQPLYPAFRLDLDSTLLICPPEGANASRT